MGVELVRVGTLYGGEVRNRPKSGQNHMASNVPYWRGEREKKLELVIPTRDMSNLKRRMAFQLWPWDILAGTQLRLLAWAFGCGLVASHVKTRQPPKQKRTNGD